jgi:hypothetical protein
MNKLKDLFSGLGMSDSVIAQHIEEASGLHMTRKLVTQAADGQKIALPKAQAIVDFLSAEYGRKITIADADIKTI